MEEVFALNSIRARFIRGEEVKYISHLDLMKVFERALRRSKLPIAYSQGFNPHPQMVFGLPLSVGVTSEAEYGEFEFSVSISPEEFMERLNNALPAGLRVLDAKEKKAKDNIMASIVRASYEVLVSSNKKLGINDLNQLVSELMQMPSVIVTKEGKKGLKDVDIKPLIYRLEAQMIEIGKVCGDSAAAQTSVESLKLSSNSWINNYVCNLVRIHSGSLSYSLENLLCLSMTISAGSASNLKPELVVSALNKASDIEIKIVKTHRTGLFVNKKGEVNDPLDESVLSGI